MFFLIFMKNACLLFGCVLSVVAGIVEVDEVTPLLLVSLWLVDPPDGSRMDGGRFVVGTIGTTSFVVVVVVGGGVGGNLHLASHSYSVSNLFGLPPHPPYTNTYRVTCDVIQLV